MATSSRGTETGPAPGIMQSLKGYLATWVELLRTRLELLATDLEEESNRIQELAILAVLSAFCFAFGVLLVTFFVVVAFWESPYRLAIVGGFAVLYLVAGVVITLVMVRKIHNRPKLFAASLGELAKDSSHLSP